MQDFDKTIMFDDYVVMNVHINSDGDLESAFYPNEDAYDEGECDDGSILEDWTEELLEGDFSEILNVVCEMSDSHRQYGRADYRFI